MGYPILRASAGGITVNPGSYAQIAVWIANPPKGIFQEIIVTAAGLALRWRLRVGEHTVFSDEVFGVGINSTYLPLRFKDTDVLPGKTGRVILEAQAAGAAVAAVAGVIIGWQIEPEDEEEDSDNGR